MKDGENIYGGKLSRVENHATSSLLQGWGNLKNFNDDINMQFRWGEGILKKVISLTQNFFPVIDHHDM